MRHLIAPAAVLLAAPLFAQQPTTPAPKPWNAPAVGSVAPDFALAGATRYGRLRDPVTLASMRGKTVVLAFFFRARTKG